MVMPWFTQNLLLVQSDYGCQWQEGQDIFLGFFEIHGEKVTEILVLFNWKMAVSASISNSEISAILTQMTHTKITKLVSALHW